MNIQQSRVYWFDPSPTKGSEMSKVRPCVVVSPNEMNRTLQTVLVVPTTSTVKSWPFRMTVKVKGESCSVACDQLRVIDKSRIKEQIQDLSPSEAHSLSQLLQNIFA